MATENFNRARSLAANIYAYSLSPFPMEWEMMWAENITRDLSSFAYHARRLHELANFDEFKSDISAFPHEYGGVFPSNLEKCYKFALNRIVHAQTFRITTAHSGHWSPVGGSKQHLIPIFVSAGTDAFPEANISLFGLSTVFLSEAERQFAYKVTQLDNGQ